ncbi:MAG: cell division protein FtsA [Alphaproteobacteria bacterium]|nr:cell division protein FtsA [Alphaproteobacteria bacterium]
MANNLIKNGYVTALDIGSGKICCMIAKVSDDNIHIVGMGCAQAMGIKNGVIVNFAQAASSIQDAIIEAEGRAKKRVESVIVNVSSPQLKSIYVSAEITIPDTRVIIPSDVRKVIDTALAKVDLKEMEIIHQIPISYTLDGMSDIEDEPTGLSGKTLGVTLHLITVPLTQIRNLSMALERCHVWIAAKVATPYASALSVLSQSEKDNGTTLIDIGSGVASMAIFSNGFIRYAAILPLGGNLITKDISYVLKTPLKDAERAKTLNGCAFVSASDEKATVTLPLIGEEDEAASTTITRKTLISIILARIEQIFDFLKMYLLEQEKDDFATRRIVLCGGFSLTAGIREKANSFLDAQVRCGKPIYIKGLSEMLPMTTMSTAIGLLLYAVNHRIQKEDKKIKQQNKKDNWIKKVFKWIIQNF